MRKTIAIIVVALVSVGIWTAGCRQNNNRSASFPNSSEMKGLAKAPGADAQSGKPPRIGPAPIDREVLGFPESTTMARAAAVDDRANQLVKPKAPDDLFTLPGDRGDRPSMASATPAYQPRPADIPAPTGREFWSRPSAGRSSGGWSPVPDDVSAMAPASESPAGSDFMAPPVKFLPPASRQPQGPAPTAPFLMPDEVPGVFMEGDPISFRSGSPPASRKSNSGVFMGGGAFDAPPPLSKRDFTMEAEGPVKLDLSGLIGSRAGESENITYITLPERRPAAAKPSRLAERPIAPFEPEFPMIVRAIPGDYEPLPEPIPLAEYLASIGAAPFVPPPPAAVPSEAPDIPKIPELTMPGSRPAEPAEVAAAKPVVKKRPPPTRRPRTPEIVPAKASAQSIAKAPLPEPVRPAAAPVAAAAVASPEIFPELPPMPALSPVMEKASDIKSALAPLPVIPQVAAKAAAANAPSELPEPRRAPPLREKAVAPAKPADPLGISGQLTDLAKAEQPKPAERPLSLPETAPLPLPELTPKAPSWDWSEMAEPEPPAPSRAEPPKRVRLQPIRERRDQAIDRIDSEMEVPPLRF